jgi:hypothetical protein
VHTTYFVVSIRPLEYRFEVLIDQLQLGAFTCSGLPKNATCTFNPASVTSDGMNAATALLSIQTSVSTAQSAHASFPGQGSGNPISLATLADRSLLDF